ncbi:MAG TPA: multicopper oxidase domain-containing protein [Candidatus Angelobacter sp.]
MNRRIPFALTILAGFLVMTLALTSAYGQAPVAFVPNPCQRPAGSGLVVHQPPALFSQNGVLNVQFSYESTTDSFGRQLFCFMTPSGLQNPTLHVNPGDTLNITVTNNTTFTQTASEPFGTPNCGDTTFLEQVPVQNPQVTGFFTSGGAMNIHYHGTNTTPQCHGDNVVKTLINPNSTFQYSVQFPTNEPPGLYWYHPHVHGLAELAVMGGAAGALVVDGINNVQPAVAGLRHRILVIRDQQMKTPTQESGPGTDPGIPQNDLSVNFVSINTTINPDGVTASYTPATIHMESGEKQFWRICNCTADAPLDLAVQFDGVNQTIQVVGIDAVPVNSQDGTEPGQLIPVTHVRIPPASRYEIIVNAPPSTVHVAQLVAQKIFSGPLGDNLPTRQLLNMQVVGGDDDDEPLADDRVNSDTTWNGNLNRFAGIMKVTPAVTRVVYFEEVEDGSVFFMSTLSCTPTTDARCQASQVSIDVPFDNNHAAAVVTTQGTVEKWFIQNHARENHELHQHQIHFKVLSQDNFEKNGSQQAPAISGDDPDDGQFADMVEVPFCGGDAAGLNNNTNPPSVTNPPNPPACITANGGGPGLPYPQVEALMDFRGPDIGDFVFHCHILGHEDRGMMAIESVRTSLP